MGNKPVIYMFYIILIFSILSSSALASDDSSLLEQYISQSVQGDLRPAFALFEKVDIDTATATDRQFIALFRDRFVDRTETRNSASGSSLADSVVSSFQQYWVDSLMGTKEQAVNEARLEENLRNIAQKHGHVDVIESKSDVHAIIGSLLDAEGFYYLNDVAPPLRDLFLWKKQETRNYPVVLTDQTRFVPVILMDDFHSMGWKYFASMGLASTTGWVESAKLYCVDWAYDRNSERFKVSYLKHEARHLADYEKFPGLDGAELEYRAKLTELAFAYHSATRLLEDFTSKSAENPDSPHAMANFRVTRDIYLELFGTPGPEAGISWAQISSSRLNSAARDLLERNTSTLEEKRKTPDSPGH